jgi:PKD domain
MLIAQMIPRIPSPSRQRRARRVWQLSILALVLAAVSSCDRVPLLAPTGSTITLSAGASSLPLNGTTQVVAYVVEAAGTAPQNGTLVTFTTTLGNMEPAQVETNNGRAVATFHAGTNSGEATITAASGGAAVAAADGVKIEIGSAAVGRVTVSANPATVSQFGGSTTITANVMDLNGNALPFAPVSFTTTAGTLSAGVVTTDQTGNAQTTLTTAQQAMVTASVGAQGGGTTGGGTGSNTGQASGSVTVDIAASPTLVITPPATPPSAGLPASFTFAVTAAANNGAAVRNVTVSWGDGATQSLGALSGNAVVSHVYNSPGTYTITADLTDALGTTTSVSTSVTVISVPKPTIIITPSPVPGHVGAQTTLTIQVTVPAGISVQDLQIDFGDGTSADLGGATSAAVPHVYTATGSYTVTVTVTDTTGQTTIGTTVVSIAV